MDEIKLLEEKRKKCPLFIYIGIGCIILGILLFIISVNGAFFLIFLTPIFIVLGIVLVLIGNFNFKRIEKEFKDLCMNKIVTEIIPNSNYYEKLGIPLNDIYRYGILEKADRAYTEDLIQGELNGVKFRICDLRLEERRVHHTSNGNHTVTYVPYFIGRFFEFDFNKTFKGDIIISETSIIKPAMMKKINLESEEFNNKFKTYAMDEFSAFYVLTPQLMMALLDLEKANPGAIIIAINSNKMCLALNNNRDTFSLKLKKPIDDHLINEFKHDIQIINQIINEMNLNNKIFKEEY